MLRSFDLEIEALLARASSHTAGKRPLPRIIVQALQLSHVLEQHSLDQLGFSCMQPLPFQPVS